MSKRKRTLEDFGIRKVQHTGNPLDVACTNCGAPVGVPCHPAMIGMFHSSRFVALRAHQGDVLAMAEIKEKEEIDRRLREFQASIKGCEWKPPMGWVKVADSA